MKDNNIAGVLNGISNVLEKLSDLAERGRQLKQTIHEIDDVHSTKTPHTTNSALQELVTTLDETTQRWIIQAQVKGVRLNQVQLEIEQQKLHLKIIQGTQLLYKEIELPAPCQLQNIHVHYDSGQLKISCSKL